MGQSQLKALKTFNEGLTVYEVLVAEPATGKTPELGITRQALVDIEERLGVTLENSRLVNGLSKF